jgi:hypothetical protein
MTRNEVFLVFIERKTEQVIKLRKEKVEQWERLPDLDFTKTCTLKIVPSSMNLGSACISNVDMGQSTSLIRGALPFLVKSWVWALGSKTCCSILRRTWEESRKVL